MNNLLSSPALLLMWLLCIPAAIITGYMLATPMHLESLGVLALILMFLLSPVMIRWHHELLIVAWNSFFVVAFLPGQPSLGIAFALMSLFFSVLARTMSRKASFISVPSVAMPLIILTIVVLVTAQFTGGMGARALGSANFGGKRYLTLLGAILGYFALTAQAIPRDKAMLLTSLFFLSGISGAISDLIYAAGPQFYFLFILFSANLASMQALSQETLLRLSGMTWGALSFCYFLLMRYGISGALDLTRPWRLLMLTAAIAVGLLGGFRSTLIIIALIVLMLFYFEGLFKTRYFPILTAIFVLVATLTLPFIERMPLAVQRSLSFLPIEVDPMAKADALSTLDWRLQIWKIMLPEIPKYLWLGKGYTFSGTDLYLTQEAVSRGMYNAYEDMIVSGNYHHGLLTTIIPFGIFGLLAFFWFCWAAIRVLHSNYKYGDPDLLRINRFLLAFFVARLVFFVTLYGQLELDLLVFTGTVGLSISLNNGVRRPATEEEMVEVAQPEVKMATAPLPLPAAPFRFSDLSR